MAAVPAVAASLAAAPSSAGVWRLRSAERYGKHVACDIRSHPGCESASYHVPQSLTVMGVGMGGGWNSAGQAAGVLAMFAMVSAVHAESRLETDAHTAASERLDAIVVTAQAPEDGVAWETDPKLPRQPVPASDGADYLKTIPGFSAIRNGGSNGDPVLRGMFGSRLNLLSNDGSMPGACPARMDNPMSYVAPETFDRVVVVKGPQTVLWGPVGSAGTVRFERDVPRFSQPGAQVMGSMLAGSHGRRDALVDATAGMSRGYVRLSGNTSESDDYSAGDGQRVPSLWDKWNADVALGWTPDEHTVVELAIGRGDGEARYAGRGMDGSQFERHSTSLRLEKSGFAGALERVEASAWRNAVDHVMDNYSLREPNPMGSMPMPMVSNVDRLTHGGRVAAQWIWRSWQLEAGADAQNSGHRRRGGMGRNAHLEQDWATDAELRNRGVFVESRFNAGGASHWIAGLRADRANALDLRTDDSGMGHGHGIDAKMNHEHDMQRLASTHGREREHTLGSGFLRYEWRGQAGVSAFAGIGHTRRMPDYWELYSPQAGPMGSVDAFEGVQPERTTQIDLGLNYRSARLDFWASAYVGRIDDYILFTYNPHAMGGHGHSLPKHGTHGGAPANRADNVDAGIRGAEAGFEYRPLAPLKLGATLAYAWGENRDSGAPLPQMPPLDVRMSAGWEAENWNAGLLWRVVRAQDRVAVGQGSIVGQDISASQGFGTLALNGSVRLGPLWRLSAGIDNLFDRAYSEHLNLAGSADFGYPAEPVRILEPGRTAWMKLDFRY